jgi:hypothetical protein
VTSRIIVVNGVAVVIPNRFAGDKALLNRVWTSVVAREHIVVELQSIYKDFVCLFVCKEKQTKRIFMRTLEPGKR